MSHGLSMTIPDFNSPDYENLILSLLQDTCIFIGAGVSKLAGYKLWDELRKAIVDYFWSRRDSLPFEKKIRLDYSMCENLKRHENIIDVFDYLSSIDKNLFISGIKEIFYSDDKKITNEIYQSLNRLNNGKNFFITTNIDMGFQKYLGLADESVSIYPNFDNPPKLITYLHGRIDKEDTWIFTRAQYNNGYVHNEAPCTSFLKYIFENYNVLFIGYGLREDDITRVISLTNKRRMHYWIERSYKNKEDHLKIQSTSLRENFNIHLVPYYIDQMGDKLLCEVIDSLYKTLAKKEEA